MKFALKQTRSKLSKWGLYAIFTTDLLLGKKIHLFSSSVWNNVFIKMQNKSVFYKSCMVHKKSGVFMSSTELINKLNLKCTFLQPYGIMCAILSSWKSKIRGFGKRLPVIKSQNIGRLFKTKKMISFTYDTLRKSVAKQPTRVQGKLNKHLPSPFEDWSLLHYLFLMHEC